MAFVISSFSFLRECRSEPHSDVPDFRGVWIGSLTPTYDPCARGIAAIATRLRIKQHRSRVIVRNPARQRLKGRIESGVLIARQKTRISPLSAQFDSLKMRLASDGAFVRLTILDSSAVGSCTMTWDGKLARN